VELCVLGRIAVVADGREHVLGATREAALLADLIVHAGQVVSASCLVEDLWRGAPPPGAAGTLQTYVKNLRRLLEPQRDRWAEGTVVSTVRPGYLLRLPPDGLDAWRCERLVGEGRAALAGDPARAAAVLREALGLCCGPAFGALAVEQYLEAEAARFDELQLVAFELRVEADLALGRHGELAGELQAVAAANPYRESLWRQWVLALYRAGRQADAVRAYQRLRRTLADELGLEPGAELRALEVAMLQQRSELDWVAPAAPVGAVSRPAAHAAPEVTGPLGGEAAGRVPLPARLAVRPAVGVVGRDTELVAVGDCVERVGAGGGHDVVVVSGEAGVGKTTLIAEAARAAFDGGACVLFGHCEQDLAFPYQLFVEALGHVVDHAPGDVLVSLVGGDGAVLAGLLPGLVRRMPGIGAATAADAEAGRYELFAAVADFLACLSARQLVVLVLEDVQWADRASLQLVRHVVGSDRPLRLVVIGSCRDSELSRSHPMVDTLAELHRLGAVTRVELDGLDDAGVAAFMEAAGGQALDPAELGFAAEVRRETGGNPFFVGEVLRHLAETGALTRDESGRWSATVAFDEMSLPPSVHAVIGARVGRLGRSAERVLSLAAVIGRDFESLSAILCKSRSPRR
jgi:DNA-binding SARP family transcriptional activator